MSLCALEHAQSGPSCSAQLSAIARVTPIPWNFLWLGLRQFTLVLLLYGLPALLLRGVELLVAWRVSPVKPRAAQFFASHALALLLVSALTPATCYVAAGVFFAAGKFTDPDAFTRSAWFFGVCWAAGLLWPVQFHHQYNQKLHAIDAELTVHPKWLVYLWGVNSCLAATAMWVPVWLGWVAVV